MVIITTYYYTHMGERYVHVKKDSGIASHELVILCDYARLCSK